MLMQRQQMQITVLVYVTMAQSGSLCWMVVDGSMTITGNSHQTLSYTGPTMGTKETMRTREAKMLIQVHKELIQALLN